MKRVVWHTLTGDHDGEEDALLAQLRLPLATSAKRIPPDQRILFPTTHSLLFSAVGRTDVLSSEYALSQQESDFAFSTIPPLHSFLLAEKTGSPYNAFQESDSW